MNRGWQAPNRTARSRLILDVALLVVRCGVGVLLIAHALEKARLGFAGTAAGMARAGVPLPHVSSAYAIVVEFLGGGLLILGEMVPLVALLVIADMCGAMVFVDARHGLLSDGGGMELPLLFAATTLLLGVAGAGRLTAGWSIAVLRGDAPRQKDKNLRGQATEAYHRTRQDLTTKERP
jgi:putative oxidoreductase